MHKTCNAYGASTMQSSEMELSNKPWLDQKRTITINSEHPDMQANKLNAKNHFHVQHSTNATTQGNCIKDIKSNKWHKSDILKENA